LTASIATDQVLLCDTTYVSQIMKAERRPETTEHWPAADVERIANSILTISVVTVAEIRMGMIKASWGERTRADAEYRLAAYAWIPLDLEIIEKWAEIQAEALGAGQNAANHNDVWIGATALVRGYPLVSCDVPQCELPQVCDNVIYLKVDPSSRSAEAT
jgi:predicted nucleic acid-binding protein